MLRTLKGNFNAPENLSAVRVRRHGIHGCLYRILGMIYRIGAIGFFLLIAVLIAIIGMEGK
jgi:hypothetical protein